MNQTAAVGVEVHSNTAVLVTVAADGALLDRRSVALTSGLSTHPYHHEGAWAVGRYLDSPWARETSLEDAIELVERVTEAAGEGAEAGLAELAAAISVPIATLTVRAWPEMPETIEACIRDARIQTMADSVMYRRAIAGAAEKMGWAVLPFDPDQVFHSATDALGGSDLDAILVDMGKTVGPPWQAKHKRAAAAAIAALSSR